MPSAATEEIIRELDIRFPPNATISEADRETQVLYLASDVADIPIERLRAAQREWVRTKAFMPKASELRNLAAAIAPPPSDKSVTQRIADEYNLRLEMEPDREKRRTCRWVVTKGGELKLVDKETYENWGKPVECASKGEVAAIMNRFGFASATEQRP